MDRKAWLKTTILAGLGGGIAAMFAAANDPTKYVFPRDFGSGKLWPFFFQGAAITIGALLIKSPLGQKMMTEIKASDKQIRDAEDKLQKDREELERLKAEREEGKQ